MKNTKSWTWIAIGASFCGIYVILGAFGAHGLEGKLQESQLATFHTGLRYLIIHSLSLILLNYIAGKELFSNKPTNYFFLGGIVLFSFSLMIHACKDLLGIPYNAFALLAPIGGLSFIIGWLAFVLKIIKK